MAQGTSNPPVLIVDGYNVLYDLAKAKRRADGGGGGYSSSDSDDCDVDFPPVYDGCAREDLERRLVEYSCARRVKVSKAVTSRVRLEDKSGPDPGASLRASPAGAG